MNRLRHWADHSRIRKILLHPVVRRSGAAALRLRYLPALYRIGHPLRFLYSDLRGRSIERYELRHGDDVVVVDHRHLGLELIWEIFHQRCYEPPDDVASLVPNRPRILDLGANVGAFVVFAHQHWPGCSLTAVEADPDTLPILHETCVVNGYTVEVIGACASTDANGLPFLRGQGAGSLVSDGGELLPSIDVLPMLRDADLAKIDIEGSEWPILADPRLGEIDNLVIVMEFHNGGCPNPPAAKEAPRLLTNAGFTIHKTDENYWGHGVLWATKGFRQPSSTDR